MLERKREEKEEEKKIVDLNSPTHKKRNKIYQTYFIFLFYRSKLLILEEETNINIKDIIFEK